MRVFGFLGLILTLAIGLFIYRSYFAGNSAVTTLGSNNARAIADVTGVKNDLIAMAQAERNFMALNGRYAPLAELQSGGNLAIDPARGRQGYLYSADIGDHHFKITAAYSGPSTGMPSLSIDETMEITQ